MHESRVYYNIFEANAQIPRLEHLFAELAKIQRQVNALSRRALELGVELSFDIDAEACNNLHPLKGQLADKMKAFSEEYSDKLHEIAALGVIVDDLDMGIVNFYSWIDGREIFLSWQYGEPEIAHWHAVTENAIARRPLKKLVSSRPAEASLH
ncbi:MAG: DUF2203 domain-containing protein [Pseudomonadota bacterium]